MRVRFAPSPTGFLHIGGARTALFNWMYAKSQNGKFILRIEDTDQERSKKAFETEILESMKWIGLDWDELYYQSQRFDIYREHAQKLLDEGKAYKDGEAIILKMLSAQEIKIYDLIRDEIIFSSDDLKDQVLMKSDGSPAYNFCCAVDDALMGITCVIRGEDHISNTPKQIMIYNALGFKPPKFAHLPLIMSEEGGRMSKRFGAVAVTEYREEGFLSEAIVNYLMLLGWSPGNNREIVPVNEAIKNFSIKKVNKTAAVFSMDKLRWVNNQYLKVIPTDKLVEILIPRLKKENYISENFDRKQLESIVDLFKGRLNTLQDFMVWADFAFRDDYSVEEEASQKLLTSASSAVFKALSTKYKELPVFDATTAHEAYKQLAIEMSFKPGDFVQALRIAITGKSIGPSLFDIMGILGQQTTVQRLEKAYK